MINQNELFAGWVVFQKTNPPKTVNRLEDRSGRCCLGNFCHLIFPEYIAWKIPVEARYLGENSVLPKQARKILNINDVGSFTVCGCRIVEIWIRENQIKVFYNGLTPLNSLSSVNDNTAASHSDIGYLLEHLAHVERALGVECFNSAEVK